MATRPVSASFAVYLHCDNISALLPLGWRSLLQLRHSRCGVFLGAAVLATNRLVPNGTLLLERVLLYSSVPLISANRAHVCSDTLNRPNRLQDHNNLSVTPTTVLVSSRRVSCDTCSHRPLTCSSVCVPFCALHHSRTRAHVALGDFNELTASFAAGGMLETTRPRL